VAGVVRDTTIRGWMVCHWRKLLTIFPALGNKKAAANLNEIRSGKFVTREPRMTYPGMTGPSSHKPSCPGEFLNQRHPKASPKTTRAQGHRDIFTPPPGDIFTQYCGHFLLETQFSPLRSSESLLLSRKLARP